MLQWIKKLKLTTKYLVIMWVCIGIAMWIMNNESLSRLKEEGVARGELTAQQAGQAYGDQNKKLITDMASTLFTYRDIATAMVRSNSADRELFLLSMGDSLRSRTDVVSFFTAWEANAFDGKDQQYVNDNDYRSAGGRYAVSPMLKGEKTAKSPLPVDFDQKEYYTNAKTLGKLSATKPYIDSAGGMSYLVSALSIPIQDQNGKFLGMVGASLNLADFQTNAVKERPLGGYVSLITDEGIYIANGSDPATLGELFTDQESNKIMWEKLQQGELMQYGVDAQGKEVLNSFVPITITEGESWYVQTVVPVSTMLKSYNDSSQLISILFIITLIVIAVAVWLLTRYMITLRLKKILLGIRQMAEGDFTGSVHFASQDEFGQMAQNLNETNRSLAEMMRHTSDLAMNVGATSEELTSSSEQVSLSAEAISQAIEEVASGMSQQHEQAKNTSQNMNEVAQGVQRIAESAVRVLESASDVNTQTEQGNQLIRQAVEQMDEVTIAMSRSSESIQKLGASSEEIGSLVGLINSISAQTNILALNASIEASRAGEHGRGFAVVATEIRSLAEQTKAAVAKVEEKIEEIRSETEQMIHTIGITSNEVSKGVASVTNSGDIFSNITQEMNQVHAQAHEVSSSVEQLSAGIAEVLLSVDHVKEIASQSTDNAHQVAASSEEQLATMQEVSSSATHLSGMVQELLDRLSRFKH